MGMSEVCKHCEKPGTGLCAECHGTGQVERPVQRGMFKKMVGMTMELVGCTSCNNPSFPGRPKGDGKCFFCKGKGYI